MKPCVESYSSQSLNNTRALANDLLDNPGDETLFNTSLVTKRELEALSSTLNDDDIRPFRPSQFHNYILEEEILVLKASIASLNLD